MTDQPKIAGHTFENGVCSCGCKRVNLSGVTRAAIGKEGWAHYGSLTEGEYREILQDQPPPVIRGVSTKIDGVDRLYHDCDMSTELVAGGDSVVIDQKTWYVVRCDKCDSRGRVSQVWPA